MQGPALGTVTQRNKTQNSWPCGAYAVVRGNMINKTMSKMCCMFHEDKC